jgi:hypothetical protein
VTLYKWAQRHGVSLAAIKELERLYGVEPDPIIPATGLSEAAVQQNLRLEASRKGVRLWRNNVGGGELADGSFIRWGLANESSQVNKVIKSGDLIGIRPLTVTPQMVGHVVGQFVSREAKPGDWKYSATEREVAQLTWINLIISLGGDAAFATGEGTL